MFSNKQKQSNNYQILLLLKKLEKKNVGLFDNNVIGLFLVSCCLECNQSLTLIR